MIVTFGKHRGQSVGSLILKEPDYIVWLLSEKKLLGPALQAKNEAVRLIHLFDAKLFQKKCSGDRCTSLSTRCTVYQTSVSNPQWWCDSCDPYQMGADGGKLQLINTYCDAIGHVGMYCNGRKESYRLLLKALVKAKGLPDRLSETQVSDFFK